MQSTWNNDFTVHPLLKKSSHKTPLKVDKTLKKDRGQVNSCLLVQEEAVRLHDISCKSYQRYIRDCKALINSCILAIYIKACKLNYNFLSKPLKNAHLMDLVKVSGTG